MTSITRPALRPRIRSGRGSLMGFIPLVRKELTEWWKTGRAAVVFTLTSLLAVMMTLTPWIQDNLLGLDVDPGRLEATSALTRADWSWVLTYIVIFTTMGLVAGERDKGTLGWTLSKPVTRQAVLLAKWAAGTVAFALAGVILPMFITGTAATVAYGGLPDPGTTGFLAATLVLLPALYIGLSVTAGTLASRPAAVAGIGLFASLIPTVATLVSADLALAAPTAIGTWAQEMARGNTVGWDTPAGWLATMLALAGLGHLAFRRSEL